MLFFSAKMISFEREHCSSLRNEGRAANTNDHISYYTGEWSKPEGRRKGHNAESSNEA